MALMLNSDERAELEARLRSRTIRVEAARRARVILMLADGDSYSTIEAALPSYRDYINRWRRRFLASRLAGLESRHSSQPPSVLTPAMDARILAKTRHAPPDGSTHWSTRKLGRHVIADNLSTHKTQAVRTCLAEHPRVRIHFTPTYSSWLNQVELWFAKIERDLLARGIFTSVQDLARRIRKYIRHDNKAPKPIRWGYRGPAHRIGSTSVNAGH